jgi:hypothetical protein
MEAFFQIVIGALAALCVFLLIRKMRQPLAPPEPADEPFADVPAPVRRGPKGLMGAVALDEPDDDGRTDAFHRGASDR